jgi:hypothetical protein
MRVANGFGPRFKPLEGIMGQADTAAERRVIDDLLTPDDWGGDLLAPSDRGPGDGLLERDDDWQCLPDFSRKKRRPRLVLVE